MAKIEKLLERLYKKPIPNDIRIDEVEKIVKHFGCIVQPGGKHPMKIIHVPSGTVIPIPIHGDTVKEAYIKQIKKLLDEIRSEELI